MKELTIKKAQELAERHIKTMGGYFSELTNLAQLIEEVGEVARVMSRTYGDQSFKESEEKKDLADELADVLFALLAIANQTEVDLTEALLKNINEKGKRDKNRYKNK